MPEDQSPENPVKPPTYRTIGDIQADYANICTQIGDRVTKIGFLQTEINQLQAKCRELNDEVNTLPKTPAKEGADGNVAETAK